MGKKSLEAQEIQQWNLLVMSKFSNHSEIFGIYFFSILEGSNNLKEPVIWERGSFNFFLGKWVNLEIYNYFKNWQWIFKIMYNHLPILVLIILHCKSNSFKHWKTDWGQTRPWKFTPLGITSNLANIKSSNKHYL